MAGWFVLSCAAPLAPPPARDCTPHFPYSQGWLGGDAAYSIPLPPGPHGQASDERTLWLFGDSFVSTTPKPINREGADFIHNSVGVSTCTGAGYKIRYFWQRDHEGGARAFLNPPAPGSAGEYWWLFGGFMWNDALYLGLLEVSPAPPSGPLELPFRLRSMKLARIDNPQAPPPSWRPEVVQLSTSNEAFPGAAMVVHQGYVYFFSFHADNDREDFTFLARLPLDALDPFAESLAGQLQTWTKSGDWQDGFQPLQAEPLLPDPATEMSVNFDSTEASWWAVYGFPVIAPSGPQADADAPDAVLSDAVYARNAEQLEGPWGPRRTLYRFPELRKTPRPAETFCYAAKAHPQLSPPNKLLITYVCSLRTLPGQNALKTFHRLQRDMTLYVPQVVVLPRPEPFTRP